MYSVDSMCSLSYADVSAATYSRGVPGVAKIAMEKAQIVCSTV